ncbi:MAG: glutathione binding-like protein [Alphaproteobacteria bacterium]|nr:glutathione binding-like protein [Alphaproteobacteria bacterium]
MYTLYYAPGACSLASHITLEEAGVGYCPVRVDFSRSEQRGEDYRAINSKARVPSLVTPRGILTETPAILAFLAQSHPDAGLAPLDDSFEFASMQAFNSYLCSTVHVAHAHRGRAARWTDDPQVIEALAVKVPANMTECFALIEATMLRGPWVMGEDYTVADPYLFTVTRWLERDGLSVDRFPGVRDHRDRMLRRPATRTVLEREGGGA